MFTFVSCKQIISTIISPAVTTAIVAVFLLSSCSANFHLKRAIKKNPGILSDSSVVTVIEKKPVSANWAFNFNELTANRDIVLNTITTEKDTVRVTLRKIVRDTAYVEVQVDCPPAEIITETKTIYIPKPFSWREFIRNYWTVLLICLAAGLTLGVRLVNRRR